jgi:hypothetical protein
VGPPSPPASAQLYDPAPTVHTTGLNQTKQYKCPFGKYLESDRTVTMYNLPCYDNGSYALPAWPNCVASEILIYNGLQWI